MPRVRPTASTRLILLAAACGGSLLAAAPARASDLGVPYLEERESYGPPPPPQVEYVRPRYVLPPPPRAVVEVDETTCRVITRRRIDDWGREVVRRVRVCDDGVVERRPIYGPPPPRYVERPFYGPPRPPRAIAPTPDFEDDFD